MTDEAGRPRVLLISAGNINDMTMAPALIEVAGPFTRLIADRGYDSNAIRALIAQRGAEAVIPSTASRRAPIPYDRDAYRTRNLVERLWCRLKDWRRIATRCDKLVRKLSLRCTHRRNHRVLVRQLSPDPSVVSKVVLSADRTKKPKNSRHYCLSSNLTLSAID